MFNLNGYEIILERPPKNGVKIYSARHIQSDSKVKIHFVPINKQSKDLFEKIYQYFLPLKKLISHHIARVYAIEKISEASTSGIAFTLGESDGSSLKEYLSKNGPLNSDQFMNIAVQIVTAINDLHKVGLFHNGLTSSNIAIAPDQNHIFINDFAFGLYSVLSTDALNQENHGRITIANEHLPYISPEQTGRMNCEIDYRTDFYSLGIIFYELLTGTPPFTGSNPMELIHAHMAKNPTIPRKTRKEIGEPLSNIIMKLLSKSPDHRYQSTYGIKSDLLHCLKQNSVEKPLTPFQVARHDISERFRFPGKIYGREIEVAMLIDEFNRVKENNIGISMIAGYSGIGKSRVVEEIQKYVFKKGGYFISGHYELLQQDIPYSALIQAFQEIVKQILTEPVDQINEWRYKLLTALGSNAQVIIDVIPEIEFIIGKHPPPPELSPGDAQNRFHMIFEKFLQVLASKEHPLTLFIDNMQWADTAGLKLIESFFTGTRTQNFYFIGAYRNNEISNNHPLFDSLNLIKDKGLPVQTITLKPISETNVCHLLSDALHEGMNQVKLLAQIVHDKTRGNPFFIKQFLETLNKEGFLAYDYENGRWQWRIEQITAQSITDNVVDFMAAKVSKLGDPSQQSLQLASCIGDSFSLALLSMASAKPVGAVVTDLREAVALGLIMPKGDAYRHMDKSLIKIQAQNSLKTDNPKTPINPADDVIFEFLHDKVRLAVYAQVPDALKNKFHLQIGKLILQNTDPNDLPGRIFSIVHHFNHGKNQLEKNADLQQMARLNLIAGKRAKDAAAYGQALNYLKTGEKFLTDNAWIENYNLIFDIKKHRMECEYLLHNFDNAEKLFQILLDRADSNEDKAAMYNQKMIMLASLAKHEDALKIGATGLRLLGVRLPKRAGRMDVFHNLLALKIRLHHKEIDSLLGLPEITDPRLLLILKMMMNLSLSAYFCQPYLASYLALDIFKMTLKHGNSSVSPFAYVIYGAALCAIFKGYTVGYQFGELALKAKNKFGGTQMTAKVLLYFGNGITIWTHHINQVIALNREGLESARDTGDLNYSVYHIQSLIFSMFAGGKPLDEILEECDRFYEFVEQSHDIGALNYLISAIQFIKCVRGETFHIHSLNDEHFSETQHIKNMQSDNIKIILCRHHLIKLRLLYIMEDYEGALKEAKNCATLRHYHLGTVIIPEYYFYHCLVLTALYNSASTLKQSLYRRQIIIFCNRLKHLSYQCPENFEDKYLLVAAEHARITGQDRQAITFYHRAIASANTTGFTQNHAIANEAAAKFYISKGFDDIAKTFMDKARQSYHYWGAKTKVDLLEKNFSSLLTVDPRLKTFPGGQHLDYNAIVNALQAISTEIVLEDLLKSLMKIVLENAGARKVQFLTIKSDRMYLEAQNNIDYEETIVYKSLPADRRLEIFNPVLNYVKRTQTYMVLDDAGSEGDFTRHPYVLKYQPKSVLCLPVIRYSQMVALLYLENNITPAVFTPERIKILSLLASQAAISLENSRLYENVIQNEKELREISEKREKESLRYQAQLRSLSSELSLTEERERRRIASDLHDRIGHALANASMKLRLVKDVVSTSNASKHIDEIHLLIDQSIQDTQTLTFELSPPILYDLGLEAALDWLTEQTQKQHDIKVDFIDDFTQKTIDESLRILLFQATRELLHNVAKHARATQVSVSISKEDDFVRIVIHDNGVGFEATKKKPGVKKGGFGIFSIQERLKHRGGRLEIKSDPHTGSGVTIISPMTARNANQEIKQSE
ncbi:MAG: AAA family ATPase [Desulfobacteraceae bacterium]|nr:AAA family ATPase [Desulfobacteraceae bacterium]MBC2757166.1 AAA family ATPase [Desulfobacteraceae bacterium]